jgi:hypothetical protein
MEFARRDRLASVTPEFGRQSSGCMNLAPLVAGMAPAE